MNYQLLTFFILLLFSFQGIANDTISNQNPYFIDSVLKNKLDTAKFHQIEANLLTQKPAATQTIIQQEKPSTQSNWYLTAALILILLTLLLRLLFDDFTDSMFEGIVSFKKFMIFYQSKKYDSLLAVLLLFVLNIAVLSLVIHIFIQVILNDHFSEFYLNRYIKITVAFLIYFFVISTIEYLFNGFTNTLSVFVAHFLWFLFSSFFGVIICLLILLIHIYNTNISLGFLEIVGWIIFVFFVFFNIIRSYQLFRTIRIPYKLHFFMYICAFKLLPLLILGKYIFQNLMQ
ncbi:MAG TPA: DUF4271 domain-containing protein [Chitinophagales bacterium]|nr:DUF4271 domain-containing protein [Chitinophagales bacterium]